MCVQNTVVVFVVLVPDTYSYKKVVTTSIVFVSFCIQRQTNAGSFLLVPHVRQY